MTPFIIICETCQARLKVTSASAIGQIMACPKCDSMVQIAPPVDSALLADPTLPTNATSPEQPVSKPNLPPADLPNANDETATGNDFQVVASSLSDESLRQQAANDATVPPPVADENPSTNSNEVAEEAPAWSSEAERSRKRMIFVGSFSVVLLLLIVISAALFFRSGDDQEQNLAASDTG